MSKRQQARYARRARQQGRLSLPLWNIFDIIEDVAVGQLAELRQTYKA
jgi:hypothetical protein